MRVTKGPIGATEALGRKSTAKNQHSKTKTLKERDRRSDERGSQVRMVMEDVIKSFPPPGCECTWRPVDYHNEKAGWMLKFRHSACPVYARKGHR